MLRPFRPVLLFAGLALVVSSSCRSSSSHEADLNGLLREGKFAQAVEQADRAASANPGDSKAQRRALLARVAFVLDAGRERLLSGELEPALTHFYQAWDLDPGNPAAAVWIKKTRRQIADGLLIHAAELTSDKDLDQAIALYEEILVYVPDDPTARGGLAKALVSLNYRKGVARDYYDQAVSALRAFFLEEAKNNNEKSITYRSTEDSLAQRKRIAVMLAEERVDIGKDFETQGLFDAARNEFRLALLVDPHNAEAKHGLNRMDRETRARQAMGKIEMRVRRGELEAAKEELPAVQELTLVQGDDLARLTGEIEAEEHKRLYAQANAFLLEYKYEEAVKVYDELLAVAPDYEEAVVERETALEFIDLAREYYEKALAATNDADAERLLQQTEIVWPGYKDVAERLAKLRGKSKPGEEE